MSEKEVLNLYADALDKWGINAQVMMLFEECGELLSAIAKLDRGRVDKDSVITELADVSIMVEQMALVFGYDDYKKEKESKLERLKGRLEKYNNVKSN